MTAAVDKRRLQRNFSSSSQNYDRYAQVQQQVVELLLACPELERLTSQRFLDIGCGTGALAGELVRVRPRLRPVLCDIAHGMTVQARRRLPSALAVDASAEALPFADGSIDLICSSSVYQWVADLPGAFGENARVLRDGGLFLFALFGDQTLQELKSAYCQAAANLGGKTGHLHRLPTFHGVRQALAQAGLRQQELRRQTLVVRHRDVTELLHSLKAVGAGNASGRAPRGLASRRLLREMMSIYRRNYGREGWVPATYEVFFGLAVRP